MRNNHVIASVNTRHTEPFMLFFLFFVQPKPQNNHVNLEFINLREPLISTGVGKSKGNDVCCIQWASESIIFCYLRVRVEQTNNVGCAPESGPLSISVKLR